MTTKSHYYIVKCDNADRPLVGLKDERPDLSIDDVTKIAEDTGVRNSFGNILKVTEISESEAKIWFVDLFS